MQPVVAELTYYPIKGCAGVPTSSTRLEPTGLAHDRRFMVGGADDGRLISQRTHSAMATIRPSVRHDGAKLALSAPGIEDLVVEVVTDGRRQEVSVFAWQGVAVDQGEDAAAWFSEVLDDDVRLFGPPPGFERRAPGEQPGELYFADGYPVFVTSESSLDALNARIIERDAAPVPMNRFRTNILVRGWPEPHTEDRPGTLTIGETEVAFAKVCKRCTVPLVDQDTGRRAGPEPIRTLADYRRIPDGGVTFGSNYVVLSPGTITIGDPVRHTPEPR
ncbi:MAG: MOSC domain-containing protein [Actinophytocola sp.]|nr:MOSC domain-containing protein [Actinophytocola sp.]